MIKNKIIFFLICFLVLNTQQAFAQDNLSCKNSDNNSLEKLERALQQTNIDWWSATEQMIANRKCKKQIPSLMDIEKEIALMSVAEKQNTTDGQIVNFSNESPTLIEAYNSLTIPKNLYDETIPIDPSLDNIQKNYQINPTCQKVKCAVEKIFGKELGDKILYLKLKYGFNVSELAFQNSSRMELNEINSLISTAQSYPASRFPLKSNKQLTKFKRGYRLSKDSEDVVAFSAISFYDKWSEQTNIMKEYTGFHEIAHYIGSELDLDENKTWLGFSGWEEKNGVWNSKIPGTTSSRYGSQNPYEDFAESVSAYRYNPTLLKEVSPLKYQYIKENVFDGLEYTEDQKCNESQSNITKMFKLSTNPSEKITQDEMRKIFIKCGEETKNYILNNKSAESSLMNCFSKSRSLLAAIPNIDKIKPPLIYLDLVKSALIRLQNIPGTKKMTPDNTKEAKLYLKNQLISDIYSWDQTHYFNYKKNSTAPVCKKIWDTYGHQSIFLKDNEMAKALDTYISKEKFNLFLINVCEKIFKKRLTVSPITKIEIGEVLDEFDF